MNETNQAHGQVGDLVTALRAQGRGDPFIIGYLMGVLTHAVRKHEDVARSVEWHTNQLKSINS